MSRFVTLNGSKISDDWRNATRQPVAKVAKKSIRDSVSNFFFPKGCGFNWQWKTMNLLLFALCMPLTVLFSYVTHVEMQLDAAVTRRMRDDYMLKQAQLNDILKLEQAKYAQRLEQILQPLSNNQGEHLNQNARLSENIDDLVDSSSEMAREVRKVYNSIPR